MTLLHAASPSGRACPHHRPAGWVLVATSSCAGGRARTHLSRPQAHARGGKGSRRVLRELDRGYIDGQIITLNGISVPARTVWSSVSRFFDSHGRVQPSAVSGRM